MISNMSITTDNVSQYQGSPVYGPDQTPFVDVEILNQESGAAPYVDLQLGWAADMFSNINTPLPSGWVQVADATSSNVRTLTFRQAGTLDPGQRLASRFFWKLSNAQTMRPGGPSADGVRGYIVPVGTDSNTGNNAKIATYWTHNGSSGGSGGSTPVNQNFNIQFSDVSLPANQGGNTYNGYPLFRPNWEADTEFKIHNGGVGTVTNPTAVLSFPANQVADAYIGGTPEWTKVAEWAENGRKGYRFRYSGSVAGGGQRSALCRVRFRTPSTVPGGTAPAKILMTAEPIQGDTFLNNNYAEQTYYTIA